MVGTARALARERMQTQILDIAKKQLADVGPAALSLRAVARELGVASSAVYRYVASRDELLTRLIVAAYDELGEAAEAAESARRRTDLKGRLRAVCSSVRDWARDNPHDWALVYGSPVPGYAAPQETIEPAARVVAILARVVQDAGGVPAEQAVRPVALRTQLQGVAQQLEVDLSPGAVVAIAESWTLLVGAVSMELFGHYARTLDPAEGYFGWLTERIATRLGIG